MKRVRLVFASTLAAIVSIVMTVTLTIVGEQSKPFKDWLKSLTGHHWVSKSWASILLYALVLFLVYAAARNVNERSLRRALWWLFSIAILGAIVLIWFFTWHFLSA